VVEVRPRRELRSNQPTEIIDLPKRETLHEE